MASTSSQEDICSLVETGTRELETEDIVGTGGSGPAIQAECKSYCLEKIFSTLGDITEIDADVLVNEADPKLEYRGGVAKAIVDKGGRVIREECMQHVRKKGHLAEGEIHVTTAGSLRAKIIIHAVSPVWKGGHNNEEEVLRETIFTCMETAAKNRLKSIAIPALGSGVFGFPARQSTKVIADGVRDFFRGDQESSIREVYLSDIKPETVRFFTEALKNSFGKQCVTEVKQRPTPKPRKMTRSTLPGAVAVLPRMPVDILSSQSSIFGRIIVKVVKGEMANEKVDVIVNTTSKSLDLTNGAVSQSLLSKGGQSLQDECTKKYPNGIKDGDIAVTGGGNLSCKRVCHVALVQWIDETTSKKMLNALMKKCLDQCEKDGFTSIAFPALGTGNLCFPKDIVAKEMFKHIATYSRDNSSSSVTDVRFVVYQKDVPTVQAFESAQQEWSSSGTKVGTLTSRNIQQDESSQSASHTPYFNGIVVIEDKFLVIDDDACNLQLYNCHDGTLISISDKLEFRPYGVCLISKTEVCVCLSDCTIIILPLKSITDKKLVKTLKVMTGFCRCYSVAKFNSEKLAVSGWKYDGMFCWGVVSITDECLDSTRDICKGDIGRTHLAIKKNTIYISCLTSDSITTGVYAYDIHNPHTQKFLYQHQELEIPGSIMAVRDYVYVCDYDRIHQLTCSGQLVTIHTVSSSVNGIFYDDQHRVLYTTSYKSNVITVYKMEYLYQPDNDVEDVIEQSSNDAESVSSIAVVGQDSFKWLKSFTLFRNFGEHTENLQKLYNANLSIKPTSTNISGHDDDPDALIKCELMNYSRLSIAIVMVCGNAMKEILSTQVPSPHTNINQAILANKSKLTSRRLLNYEQIQLVFPDPLGKTTGKVDQFNLILLYILIRHISTVPAPVTGWGNDPQARDSSLGASVERIRSYRNWIYGHSMDLKICQNDFNLYWDKIDAVLADIEVALGRHGYREQLEKHRRFLL